METFECALPLYNHYLQDLLSENKTYEFNCSIKIHVVWPLRCVRVGLINISMAMEIGKEILQGNVSTNHNCVAYRLE